MWVRLLYCTLLDTSERFQFTHPCGCDGQAVRNIPIPVRFNSRTRVGATARKAFNVPDAEVSIHAPVWVRQFPFVFVAVKQTFQFTHPCGCDHRSGHGQSLRTSFNSRTRVGATTTLADAEKRFEVSIHAPVWVRPGMILRGFIAAKFQFTHPCGCDAGDGIKPFNYEVSIHAPVWVRRPDEYGLSIKHATKVLRQPDARTRCGQA